MFDYGNVSFGSGVSFGKFNGDSNSRNMGVECVGSMRVVLFLRVQVKR